MKKRCQWVEDKDEVYQAYHDKEWGVPVHEDRKHFEMLILEGAQAGLSWETILKKRENYRLAFDGFDPERVAAYNEQDILRLLDNPGIVRNRLKIRSAVGNAHAFLQIQAEFGSFDAYIWKFVDGRVQVGGFKTLEEVPAKTALSDAISKDLKKRGMKFVGSTIIYSYLQAVGIVNDHTVDCDCYQALLKSNPKKTGDC